VRPVLEIEHASGILWASDVDIAGLANGRDGPGGVARVRANIPEIDPQSNPWVTFANRSEIYFWGLRIAAFGGHGAGSNRLPSAYSASVSEDGEGLRKVKS
jgi:hypothetical protein